MRKFKLKNGLTVISEPRKSDTVAIEVCVSTGSNNEPKNIAGISHFLEHMVFDGTATRTAKEISETIEDVGGEMNAATSNERTFFYIKLPKSKFRLGLDILSDMMINPVFRPDSFEKERKVVLEEIKMVTDQPIIYQWILFEKSIFKKHPTKDPVYGRVESVKAITRKQMKDYHDKWYVPNNMCVSVVGNIPDLKTEIQKRFGMMKPRPVPKVKKIKEPIDKKPTIAKKKKNTNQAYLVLGHKTVTRLHKDSYVLDVISAIYSKGLSGRINDEIRVKRGLAYSVGASHESKKDFGFFVFHLNCAKSNLALSKRIILEEIQKLDNIPAQELKAAKDHIIGRVVLENEDSQRRADDMAFWEFIKDAKLSDQYLSHIKKVTHKDIIRVRDKYLGNNYTMAVISK